MIFFFFHFYKQIFFCILHGRIFVTLQLPIWKPPVPRELENDEGAILDLAPGGNKDIGTLDEATEDALTETIDPATVALTQVCFLVAICTYLIIYRVKYENF